MGRAERSVAAVARSTPDESDENLGHIVVVLRGVVTRLERTVERLNREVDERDGQLAERDARIVELEKLLGQSRREP